ncbi:hypothetical protein PCASD_02096 [Puccinia coronata f. sp. avenae]|uniref:Uncharacterized protein n=1 Tax=Puccinia coronata f. sp. avenae TaxID=200324 RepID=A0A2N5VPX3_9BASI|nr:hypothetical protein PCASD_02096 [Puccinia coronata f. sp. avenae]
MAQLAFLLGLLIARCPIPCIAPGDELDLELRLSSSLTDPDPSLKQHAAIIHPNAGVSVSGGPDLVMTTPSWLAFQSRVANPPSTDARISTSGSVDDSIAPITLKSPTEAGPQRQEPRNMGAGILLKELPQWTGANTPLPSFIQRSSSIQQVAPLEKSLDHTGTRP